MSLFLLALVALQGGADGVPAKQGNTGIDLQSDTIGVLGIPLAESKQAIFRISIKGTIDPDGNGKGTLILEPAGTPEIDDFGFRGYPAFLPAINLDCQLKFEKSAIKTYYSQRLGAERGTTHTEEWRLYSVTGTKIKSPIFLALLKGNESSHGRFILHGPQGKAKYAIELRMPPQPEPCHPGCFPAGTLIDTPAGTSAIERLREGDSVTTIGADGAPSQTRVYSVFMTQNRLIAVKTEAGTLITTETQPLCLADGRLKAAGELKGGEQIQTWMGKAKSNTTVKAITPTGRTAQVFNLILGEPVFFVANGYLARSKPPKVVAVDPVQP